MNKKDILKLILEEKEECIRNLKRNFNNNKSLSNIEVEKSKFRNKIYSEKIKGMELNFNDCEVRLDSSSFTITKYPEYLDEMNNEYILKRSSLDKNIKLVNEEYKKLRLEILLDGDYKDVVVKFLDVLNKISTERG